MHSDFYSSSPYDYLSPQESYKGDFDWIRDVLVALKKSPIVSQLLKRVTNSVEDILDGKNDRIGKYPFQGIVERGSEEGIQYQYLLSDFHIGKQKPHSGYCGHLNLEGLLNFLSRGKQEIIHFTASSSKIGLLPESFVKIFDEYAPREFSIDIIHPEEKDVMGIIEKQIEAGFPVPIIYIPLGGTVKFPHYATIVGIGKNKEGARVFRIEDSLQEYISKDFLTENELIECLNLTGISSSNHMEQILSKSIQKFAEKSFGGRNTLFRVTKHGE